MERVGTRADSSNASIVCAVVSARKRTEVSAKLPQSKADPLLQATYGGIKFRTIQLKRCWRTWKPLVEDPDLAPADVACRLLGAQISPR